MGMDLKKVLPIVSVVGTIATGALSAWGALKVKEHEEDGRKKWIYAIPGVGAAALTIGSIVMNQKVTAAEIAALSGTAAYLVKKGEKFKEILQEDYGIPSEEVHDAEVRAEKQAAFALYQNGEKFTIPYVEKTGHGDQMCVDLFCGRPFTASKEWVEKCVNDFKGWYADGSGVCFNDLWEHIGLHGTQFGWTWGFPAKSDEGCVGYSLPDEIDVKVAEEDGIVFIYWGEYTWPVECWYEY